MSNRKGIILIALIFIAGFLIFMYPTFSDAWNRNRDSHLITEYQSYVEDAGEEQLEEELEKAEAYNKTLLGGQVPDAFAQRDGIQDQEYESLLNINNDGVIGYVEIPAIDVKLPVYHYTTDEVLQKGAGHLFGSSLPVGGESTHAVISAHRGLPSAKMFTDLNLLEEGDIFTVHVLGRTVTYKTDQIKTVEPDNTSDLGIEKGSDYVTLLTCTPYGVNTQRLLVRGHRVSNEEAGEAAEVKKAAGRNPGLAEEILCAAAGVMLGVLVIFTAGYIKRKRSNR